jgi:uncharacterized RDD family membrane protein YckC
MIHKELEYAGFWIRLVATFIDTVIVCVVIIPLIWVIYGASYFDPTRTGMFAGSMDFLLTWILPAVAVVLFWMYKQGTPGKMALGLSIVDASSGKPLTLRQCAIRYVGYIVSTVPLGLGFLWVGFDSRKQAWHDKLAHSVVVRRNSGPLPVSFSEDQAPDHEQN